MELVELSDSDRLMHIHSTVLAVLEKGEAVSDGDLLIYDIEDLIMESNSGASFEQYFRWARIEQISRIVQELLSIGFVEAADITQRAINTAFSGGLPKTEIEKGQLTDWTEKQETELVRLFKEFAPMCSSIEKALVELLIRPHSHGGRPEA